MKKLFFLTMVLMLILSGCGGNNASSGSNTGGSASSSGNDAAKSSAEPSSAPKVAEVKIGGLYPLSGGLASEGQDMANAVQMAVDEVNAAGGIKSLGGAKVVLDKADSEGKPQKGVSEVQRLDRDGVVGILGTYASGVALPATQEAEKAKIPFVVDIAVVNEITERGFKYTFRIQPPAKIMANNFLSYISMLNDKSSVKLSTAVLAHEDSVFGSSIAALIKENAAKSGIKTLEDIPYPASTPDMSSVVNKIKSLNPDIVVTTGYLRDGTMLIKGLHDANVKPKSIIGVANGAFSNQQFITQQKDINQNIMDVNYTINPKSDLANQVKEKYKNQFQKDMSANAAYSYTAAQVLLDAIERAASADRDKIREALTQTDFSKHILPQSPIKFDATGQNVNAQAVLNQIFDGKSQVVFPDDYKTANPVYPMP
ncbi:ABC transporter substrate-binding protein [Ferviditalea candida]|uniref:ABC transporter substrate-binding protein n=1 Tax=Ferviditalea candida TaxID=3108399 RepID=A0ABU5ZGN8_9BACL|nr:ABC transporter substrate-binding protein [Paenibacillaceae bacterium T2]